MRISEAMALGRTLIKPLAGHHISRDRTEGCAWGMVNVAAPSSFYELWVNAVRQPEDLPCGCTGMIIGGGMSKGPAEGCRNLGYAIIHLFNDHVMTRKDWTMDQLIDWVRSVEPADPEPKETEECEETRALVAHS